MTLYLGENIRKLRLEKSITQETLADFLGVTFQSVSRWERGEGYPDITILPEIAGFFNVSVDELLGVNKAKNEAELTALLEKYDRSFRDEKSMQESMNELIKKYPGDFRVQLRYMSMLLAVGWESIEDYGPKILSIYENIQKNCTDDTIRIAAKNQYINYLCRMISVKDSGITFDDAEKVINELPEIKDCREMHCLEYEYFRKVPDKVYETMETHICMLFDILTGRLFHRDLFSADYRIDMLEKITAFLDNIYDDGNYGAMWTRVISTCYGVTAIFCYEKGDKEKTLEKLAKAARLAAEFDNLETVTTMHSAFFEGKIFDKNTLGNDFSVKTMLRESLTQHYGFSEEFKSTPEFLQIVKMLS